MDANWLKVNIKRYFPSSATYKYEISCQYEDTTWTVNKRFSEFEGKSIRKKCFEKNTNFKNEICFDIQIIISILYLINIVL